MPCRVPFSTSFRYNLSSAGALLKDFLSAGCRLFCPILLSFYFSRSLNFMSRGMLLLPVFGPANKGVDNHTAVCINLVMSVVAYSI